MSHKVDHQLLSVRSCASAWSASEIEQGISLMSHLV